MTIRINKVKLIEFFFRDGSWLDAIECMEDSIVDDLTKNGKAVITLTHIFNMTTIPSDLIINKHIIPENRKDNEYDDGFDLIKTEGDIIVFE